MSLSKVPVASSARRTPGLVGLLLITLAVTTGLAYQAIDAARAQRATGEAVLRDYASFAAEQYAGRVGREIAFYGLYPTLTWMQARDMGGRTAFADLAEHRASAESGNLRQSLELQTTLFRLDLETGTIGVTPNPAIPPDRLRNVVEAHRRETFDDEWSHALVYPELIAYTIETPDTGPAVAYGTVMDPSGFEAYFRAAFTRAPLLPTTLIGSAPVDSVLWATVWSARDEQLFELSPPQPGATGALTATHSLGAQLGGLAVRVAVQPAMAERLVIGGLPASRVPLTVALVALAAGLILITALQWQRERELARLQTEFVSNVSHELRTPLAQIRMFAETLLLGRVRTGEEQTRALRIIDKEARRLTTLVENVLHFSRVERRRMFITLEPVALHRLVGEVIDTFRPIAATKGVTVALDPRPVQAVADAGAVQQIMLNLLDNAVKYGPQGQTVIVTVGQRGDRAEIAVADEGPGIPERERERIWKRFQRGPDERHAGTAGAGIGLVVVRELAHLHGGRAWVEDGERGARFIVSLPLAAGLAATDRETETSRVG